MFPGTALMYWLGTKALHDLRDARRKAEGAAFSLRQFHDRVLGFGSIPVPLIAQVLALILLVATGCTSRSGTQPPSNDLLIVGYDREPDTMNRFSTHILEDIQGCVVEGLTTTNERMEVVPLLATEVPTIENGGVRLRPDGGMDVVWKLRPGVKWHDGVPFTSADIRFTVEAINSPNYNPESTDGFDRIGSVETPDQLTAIVRYKEVYAPYAKNTCSKGETSTARRTTTETRLAPDRTEWPNGEAASTSCWSAWPTTGAAASTRRFTA
jgi:hypothetical protein